MDLGAYAQIEDLEEIAKKNGIEVPRLRGYRLMKNEFPVDIKEVYKDYEIAVSCCKQLCESYPFWSLNPLYLTGSKHTDSLKDKFLIFERDDNGYKTYTSVRWDKIHGWKRRTLKFAIKNYRNAIKKQYEMWNNYCGRDDIMYIHAKLGSWCWFPDLIDEVRNQVWYIDSVDDAYDQAYCDIYAKIEK